MVAVSVDLAIYCHRTPVARLCVEENRKTNYCYLFILCIKQSQKVLLLCCISVLIEYEERICTAVLLFRAGDIPIQSMCSSIRHRPVVQCFSHITTLFRNTQLFWSVIALC